MKHCKEEIQALVQLCWEVACEAPLHGTPMVLGRPPSPFPGIEGLVVDTVRMTTYQTLLQHLLPHSAVTEVQVKREREPWQGEEDA